MSTCRPYPLPIAMSNSGQGIRRRLGMILVAPGAKNPCPNRTKYVKYLLTRRISTSGRLGGDASIQSAFLARYRGPAHETVARFLMQVPSAPAPFAIGFPGRKPKSHAAE